eukprot:TRINITY_DN3110_c0_g1_i1.p1 TRINITY_DN3110_c0_g1~~TRINITY_DN3110_c0_g1_i1.p1  ORF type:complete len:489 (-),score=119.79 TRINITY_DN3110_c0_g1_i1:70-1536(-)
MESPDVSCCFGGRKRGKSVPAMVAPAAKDLSFTSSSSSQSVIPNSSVPFPLIVPLGPHIPCLFRMLSNEIVLYIMRLLSVAELGMMARVCKRLRDCAYDKTLWRNLAITSTLNKRRIGMALKMLEDTSRLTNVRCVNLNNPAIKQDTIEYIISHAPSLKEIRLHNLKLNEKTAKLLVAKCPHLEQVYMDGGRTSDDCLELLANGAIRLKSINLHKVENITTAGICHIIKNTNLSFLNFNGISGWDIRTLAPYCAHFTSMDLGSSNNLSDDDLKALTRQCKKLKFISLKNCKLITDTGVSELIRDCPQLTDLNLSTCAKISRIGVGAALQHLHLLQSLNLSGFKQLHPLMLPLCPYRLLPNLTSLDLSFTDVKDEDIVGVGNYCANLKNLRLAGCTEVSDVAMSALAQKCKKLHAIDLCRELGSNQPMRVTMAGIEEIAKGCPELHKVNLSYSSRSNITKRAIMDLNEWRVEHGMKVITFCLNEEIVTA